MVTICVIFNENRISSLQVKKRGSFALMFAENQWCGDSTKFFRILIPNILAEFDYNFTTFEGV